MTLRDGTELFSKRELKKNKRIYSRNLPGLFTLVVFVMLSFSLGSCEAVTGIFKAGMGFGIFIVVAVIIAIVVLFMRMNRNKN